MACDRGGTRWVASHPGFASPAHAARRPCSPRSPGMPRADAEAPGTRVPKDASQSLYVQNACAFCVQPGATRPPRPAGAGGVASLRPPTSRGGNARRNRERGASFCPRLRREFAREKARGRDASLAVFAVRFCRVEDALQGRVWDALRRAFWLRPRREKMTPTRMLSGSKSCGLAVGF